MAVMNHRTLLDWYEKEKRDLPFRQDRDPYKIWISEIMSQQTRIETLLPYYRAFVEKWPDEKALAAADEDELLKAWQGLGYYSRARNLKKAALQCMERFDGKLPQTKKELMSLAGIGDYTAGAIASIAHDQRVSAIDGNVIRVYARYYGLKDDFSKAKNRKHLEKLVENDLPEAKQTGNWNQALMELGARVCMPKKADCMVCPLREGCESFKTGNPLDLPVRSRPKDRKVESRKVIVQAAWKDGQWCIHLRRRPEQGLLAGLFEFDEELPDSVLEQIRLGSYLHVFTHKEWQMSGTLVITTIGEGFLPIQEIEKTAAIPGAFMPFYLRAKEVLHEKAR